MSWSPWCGTSPLIWGIVLLPNVENRPRGCPGHPGFGRGDREGAATQVSPLRGGCQTCGTSQRCNPGAVRDKFHQSHVHQHLPVTQAGGRSLTPPPSHHPTTPRLPPAARKRQPKLARSSSRGVQHRKQEKQLSRP